MRLLLNDSELAALQGLPHVVVCLYVLAIRPRMDYQTGMLGIKPLISWHALTEWLYVEPEKGGFKSGSPSRWAVMRYARRLERAGLVRIASNVCNRQLIFECLLSDTNKRAQKSAAPRPHHAAAPRSTEGKQAAAAPPKQAAAAQHRSTEYPSTNDRHHNKEGTHTGTGQGGGGELIWPKELSTGERKAIERLIDHYALNGSSQLMLDELQGQLSKKQITNRPGYARRLIEAIVSSDFVPELADRVKEQRERAAAHAQAAEQFSRAPAMSAEDRAKGEAALQRIRKSSLTKRKNNGR